MNFTITFQGGITMIQQVKCPICGHRLFDKEENAQGVISIKCSYCRKIAKVMLEKSLIKNAMQYCTSIPSNGTIE